jgi:dTDP-4-dehydrorhamnose reductase
MQTTLFKDVFYTPILISEMVLAVQELVRLNTFGIFHLVGDSRITKYDFGVMIADEFGLDSNLIAPGLFANQSKLIQRPYDMSLSNQKICKVLNRALGGPRMHVASLRNQRRQSFRKISER